MCLVKELQIVARNITLRLLCDRFVFRDSLLKASIHTQALIERYQFKAHQWTMLVVPCVGRLVGANPGNGEARSRVTVSM